MLTTDVGDLCGLLGSLHQIARMVPRPPSIWKARRGEEELRLSWCHIGPLKQPKDRRPCVAGPWDPLAHSFLVDQLVLADAPVRIESASGEVYVAALDVTDPAHTPSKIVEQPHEAAEQTLSIDSISRPQQQGEIVVRGDRPPRCLGSEPWEMHRLLRE
ncbi:MAG TPA: hypothetical protein VFE05_09730 [Longimicrobiaceae bacterium]|nr:hypothetical protein [Longimicrobiaceae bacterium]